MKSYKEIKYTMVGCACGTPCPNGKSAKVGSASCHECEYFGKDLARKKIVECSFGTRHYYCEKCGEVFTPGEWKPKYGEKILVSNDFEDGCIKWERVFVGMDVRHNEFVAVADAEFIKANGIRYTSWKHAWPITETVMSISEIEKVLGISNLKIKKEK